MAFLPTIGLEIHAELRTKTKAFCSSKNDPDEEQPNVNVCPVCLAHPGTLPVLNREAVRQVLRVGTALGATLADYTEFDRKSYFYPDIPKGYQISQYERPLVSGGSLAGVAITRIHLEEDTARSIHGGDVSLIDFNRAGIPLMELVTEPVIHDAATAGKFARELQLLLRTLGASEANLEKGEMRIEANISVSDTEGRFGTKVEVKNINSFRSVERAIEFEIARQIGLIEGGGAVVQETRGWDEHKQQSFHQRFKEGSADYRYFPEPDLPKLMLSEIPEFAPDVLRASLPELPWERRERYVSLYALKPDTVSALVSSSEQSTFFDTVVEMFPDDRTLAALAANYIVSDLAGLYAKQESTHSPGVSPTHFAKLIRMIGAGELSSRGAKDTLAILLDTGEDPETIAKEKGLLQVHDQEALRAAVRGVLAQHKAVVDEYRGGKASSLQFLIGASMKATKGAGNPTLLKELLLEELI